MEKKIGYLLSRIQELETKKSARGYDEEIEVIADETERRVYDLLNSCSTREEEKILLGAVDRIKKLRSQPDSDDEYDEEAELDMMFPNRQDDDFDEDSMSYESVFGKD